MQEALEEEGLEADQCLRPVGLTDERVRHASGAERERAGRQREAFLADIDRELPFEDVEPLVLLRVDVPRGALAGTDGDLQQPELAAGVGAADLDDLEHSQQPVRLALVLAESVTVFGALYRYGG